MWYLIVSIPDLCTITYFLFIVTSIVGVCNVICFVVRYFMSILVLHSSKWGRESWLLCLIVSSKCLVVVERLFLAVPWGCLRFVIVVFPDDTHLLLLTQGGTSFVDHLYFLCLVFLMLSRLFIAVLWSPVGKGLMFVMFIVFLLLSHVVSWVRCGT